MALRRRIPFCYSEREAEESLLPRKCALSRVMPLVALALVLPAISVCAQESALYRPQARVSGTIRSWGSAQMAELMRLWEHGFQRYHPAVRFDDRLTGTVS